MKQYRIKVIAHCIKNNKIAKHNDVVDESQLTGPAAELIAQGFIEEVKAEAPAPAEEDKVEPTDSEVKAEVKAEAPAKRGGKK